MAARNAKRSISTILQKKGDCEQSTLLKLSIESKDYSDYSCTYGCGVGGFGRVTNFSIGLSGLISFLGDGVLGGDGSFAGGGDGGGVGVGDLSSSLSSKGSGDGISRKASWSWSANFDFVLLRFSFGLSGDFGSFYTQRKKEKKFQQTYWSFSFMTH